MNVLVPSTRRRANPTTVVAPPPVAAPVAPPVVAAPLEAAEAFPATERHRWFLLLGISFVVGAAFFGLAIGLDKEWPMAPAFLLGPLVMIAAYIYLALTSESNTELG
jgi:hypothetical protein